MLSRRLPIVVLVLSLAAFAATTRAQSKVEPRPLLVGVLDLGEAFKNYKRKADLEAEINADKDRLEQRAKESTAAIERLRKDLDLLKEGSELWTVKRGELSIAVKAAESLREELNNQLATRATALTVQLLDEVNEAVRDFAKANGYDVIIKKDAKGWGDERFQERVFRAQVETVLYADARMDVTQGVLELLNSPENLKRRRFH
jgi:Skp family chaperone for outer membrane proteins